MSKIAIVTDSNSGITQQAGKEMGISVLPMPFYINGQLHFEDIDLTQEQFYEALQDPNADVTTSQPAPGDVTDLWKKLLEDHDSVVHIPMSSGLSSSCETAQALSAEFDGRVQVVNNQRISVTLRRSVVDAMNLRDAGRSASEIREILEDEKFNSSIYIMVDNLKYLKKGGRITPAAALVGSVLNLKPVLQIQGEKLDAYAKCRGLRAAKNTMLEAIRTDMTGRFASFTENGEMSIHYSYSGVDMAPVEEWVGQIREAFPGYTIEGDPLSLSISCHIGPGALAITCEKNIN